MKSILIFGCNGFIGSSLTQKFLELGHDVYGCDIQSLEIKTLKRFFNHTLLEDSPEEIFAHKYDICINCAGSASVPYSFENPFLDYELNTRIVFRILNELWKIRSGTRFINLSSAAVYGNPTSLPISESSVARPISPYGNHKLMSEMIVNQFRSYFGMEATSLRIFSAYGPGLKKQIFWDMYCKSLHSNRIEMFGSGKETRDFIYIDDLFEAIRLIAFTNEKILPYYNIANGEEISIEYVSKLFCENISNELSYKFSGSGRDGDPSNWRADISNIQKLGYAPTHSILKGIEKTTQWLKEQK